MRRFASIAAVLGLAVLGVAVAPHDANAWWRYRYGVRVWVPPVVVVPPGVVYAPPPPVYYVPRRVWIPPHWDGPYLVPGHWG